MYPTISTSLLGNQRVIGAYTWLREDKHGIPCYYTMVDGVQSSDITDELSRRGIPYECHEQGKHSDLWRVTVEGDIAVAQLRSGLTIGEWAKKILKTAIGSTKVKGTLHFHSRKITEAPTEKQMAYLEEALGIEGIPYYKISDSMVEVSDEAAITKARDLTTAKFPTHT